MDKMTEKIDRYLVMYELEKSNALPLPNALKLQQFVVIDMPFKEEGYSDAQIFKVAIQKGATRKNIAVVSKSIITKPDYTPEIDSDFETE